MIERRWAETAGTRVPVVVLAAVDARHGLARLSQVWADRLRAALAEPVSEHTAVVLASVPVVPLDEEGRLLRVQLADRVLGWAQAQVHAALADYAGAPSDDGNRERHLRLEVRIARRSSDDAAGSDIDEARRLAGPCLVVRDLLAAGQISARHVWPVLNRTAGIADAVTVEAIARIADRLPRMAATGVGGSITRALAKVDSRAQAAKARAARAHNVGVTYRSLPDGLAQITATHKVEDARTIMEIIDTTADRFLTHQGSCEPCAEAIPHEIGPARATAHLAMVLRADPDQLAPAETSVAPADQSGSLTEPTDPTSAAAASSVGKRRRAPRRRGETQVVMDFTTWLGLDDNPAMVAGHPIPADIAREIAATTGSLRRIVTDPADGHLIDHGNRIYLPDDLRRHIAARDAHCQAPGCRQPANRCELEHIIPFPQGASSTTNTDMYCKRDHISKTRRDIEILTHGSDGSATWQTRHGQTGTIDPRPYLNPPEPPTPHDPWTDDPPPY